MSVENRVGEICTMCIKDARSGVDFKVTNLKEDWLGDE
jgi:hypothetical protein